MGLDFELSKTASIIILLCMAVVIVMIAIYVQRREFKK